MHPQERLIKDCTILFIDIVGSVVISDFLGLNVYDDTIIEFQELMKGIMKRNKGDKKDIEFSVRGDEAVMILYTDNKKDDIELALRTAFEAKIRWIGSSINQKRIEERKHALIDLAVGINHGKVLVGPHPSMVSGDCNAEGYEINIAKRIEGASRGGKYSKIMVSHAVLDIAEREKFPVEFTKGVVTELKGIYEPIPIYEVRYQEMWLDEIKNHGNLIELIKDVCNKNPSYMKWLGFVVADFYFSQEEYKEAQNVYKRLLKYEPAFAPLHHKLGRALWRHGEREDAIDEYKKAVEEDPDLLWVYADLAYALQVKKDFVASSEYLKKAIGKESNFAYAYNLLGLGIARKILDTKPSEPYEQLLDEVNTAIDRYLQRAMNINSRAEFLYSGTLGHLFYAKGKLLSKVEKQKEEAKKNYEKAKECIMDAEKKACEEYGKHKPIREELFHYTGMYHLRFIAPRYSKLKEAWDKLLVDIDSDIKALG